MDRLIEQLNAEFDVEAVFKRLNKISNEKQRYPGYTAYVEEMFVQVLNEAHNMSIENVKKYHDWLLDNFSLVPKESNNP